MGTRRVHNLNRPPQDALHGSPRSSWGPWLIGLGLIAATLLAYHEVRHYGFVEYDDPTFVRDNHSVQQGLTKESLRWAFTHSHAGQWAPLLWLSFMIDTEIQGPQPQGYHLTNVLLHALNVLLLFLVLQRMTRRLWPSAAVAALFALHPLHVESVAWITERKDTLSTTFWLLTMGAYTAYARRGGIARYLLTCACLAAGLMTKSMLVTLPFVLLLLDYWPLQRMGKPTTPTPPGAIPPRSCPSLVLEKVPLLLLTAGSIITVFLAQQQVRAVVTVEAIPFPARLANALVSYGRYLGKLIRPVDLAVLYPHPHLYGGTGWPTLTVAAAGLLLTALTILFFTLAWRWRRRYLIVGWLWFLGTMVPVIGVVQVGAQAMADRYSYIPFIGLYLLAAWSLADLAADHKLRRWIVSAIVAVVLATCLWLTRAQVRHWEDSVSLFSHAVAVNDRNLIMRQNLGEALLREGDLDQAIEQFQAVIAINPRFDLNAYVQMGIALARQGRVAQALEQFSKALALNPKKHVARYNLAHALSLQGRRREAVEQYETLLELSPDYPGAANNLAWLLATQPQVTPVQVERAVALAEKAVAQADQDDPSTLDTLAAAYARAGRFPQAIAVAQRALRSAERAGKEDLASEIHQHLQRYQQGLWCEVEP